MESGVVLGVLKARVVLRVLLDSLETSQSVLPLTSPCGKLLGRVSVRDRGRQLTLSGTTACVNGHELKDSKGNFLILGIGGVVREGGVVARDKWSCPAAAGRQ